MPKDNMPDWAKQQIADEKQAKGAEREYNKAMVNTPAAPKKTSMWGAKTGIEADAVERAVKKDYAEYGGVRHSTDDERRMRKMDSARNEAVNEIKRETRGKAPKAYAKGGTVRGYGAARGAKKCKIC